MDQCHNGGQGVWRPSGTSVALPYVLVLPYVSLVFGQCLAVVFSMQERLHFLASCLHESLELLGPMLIFLLSIIFIFIPHTICLLAISLIINFGTFAARTPCIAGMFSPLLI